MNPWSERKQARQDAAKAWGIVDEKNQTIADLEHQLASANSLIARMNDRADKLLAKVYELRGVVDCFGDCFVAYGQRRYDDVCVTHFDEIGRELSRERRLG